MESDVLNLNIACLVHIDDTEICFLFYLHFPFEIKRCYMFFKRDTMLLQFYGSEVQSNISVKLAIIEASSSLSLFFSE
jgi:hypothetical protein